MKGKKKEEEKARVRSFKRFKGWKLALTFSLIVFGFGKTLFLYIYV